jgi:hypothetical protein
MTYTRLITRFLARLRVKRFISGNLSLCNIRLCSFKQACDKVTHKIHKTHSINF